MSTTTSPSDSDDAVNAALAAINETLHLSHEALSTFRDRLFEVALLNDSPLGAAASAAAGFAKQGLTAEEALQRANDALVLARLAGLSISASVETLTAAINAFAGGPLTSAEVVDKLAATDARFAVSARDLAEALTRVGDTAKVANVSFDELVALVSAAQTATGRCGAVIGNALKTVLTRLNSPDTQAYLHLIGVESVTEDDPRPSLMQTLQGVAARMATLDAAAQSQMIEHLGGVYQFNVVMAIVADLSAPESAYKATLKCCSEATWDAKARNLALIAALAQLRDQLS